MLQYFIHLASQNGRFGACVQAPENCRREFYFLVRDGLEVTDVLTLSNRISANKFHSYYTFALRAILPLKGAALTSLFSLVGLPQLY